MDRPDSPSSRGRESFVALMLATLAGGGFLLFLILVSGGFFFYVLCTQVGVFSLASFHYLLWGRTMEREVAFEREAQEEEELPANGSRRTDDRIRRF
jgi:hypothetical protein